jgi:hypothetical protein
MVQDLTVETLQLASSTLGGCVDYAPWTGQTHPHFRASYLLACDERLVPLWK